MFRITTRNTNDGYQGHVHTLRSKFLVLRPTFDVTQTPVVGPTHGVFGIGLSSSFRSVLSPGGPGLTTSVATVFLPRRLPGLPKSIEGLMGTVTVYEIQL